MHIHTIDENFEYRMKRVIQSMRDDYDELKTLNAEEIQNELTNIKGYAEVFAARVVEDCIYFSGDELFEMED